MIEILYRISITVCILWATYCIWKWIWSLQKEKE